MTTRFERYGLCTLLLAAFGPASCAEPDPQQTTTNTGHSSDGDGDSDDESESAATDPDPDAMDAGKPGVSKADAGKSDANRLDAGATDAGKAPSTDAAKSDGTVRDAASSVPRVDGGASSDAAQDATAEPAVVSGCGTTRLYQVDETDTGVLGPWPVGVKTLSVPVTGSALTVEVWYPAKLGSAAGKAKQTYDLRDWLPKGASKIPEAKNKLAVCECYRELELDDAHGPYPVVLYIHGLGSMRVASLSTMAQWASRGFVVVAADHPGDMLTDFLASFGGLSGCSSTMPAGGDMASEAKTVLEALQGKKAGFEFLGEAADVTRLALGGHSQGGGTVAGMAGTANVKLIMTLAPLGGGALSAPVESMLQVTGTIDSVTGYSTDAYKSDSSPIRRHVGIKSAGHIDVTDLCKEKNAEGKTAIEVTRDEGVCGASILSGLAQCGGDAVATEVAPLIVNYATTAALEETLHCQKRDAAWGALQGKFKAVSEYLHTP